MIDCRLATTDKRHYRTCVGILALFAAWLGVAVWLIVSAAHAQSSSTRTVPAWSCDAEGQCWIEEAKESVVRNLCDNGRGEYVECGIVVRRQDVPDGDLPFFAKPGR